MVLEIMGQDVEGFVMTLEQDHLSVSTQHFVSSSFNVCAQQACQCPRF